MLQPVRTRCGGHAPGIDGACCHSLEAEDPIRLNYVTEHSRDRDNTGHVEACDFAKTWQRATDPCVADNAFRDETAVGDGNFRLGEVDDQRVPIRFGKGGKPARSQYSRSLCDDQRGAGDMLEDRGRCGHGRWFRRPSRGRARRPP